MNKKVIFIASAVLAFFAGAIWANEVPTVAPLAAFLEMCAGFSLGVLLCRENAIEAAAKTQEEIESLKSALKTLKQEKDEAIAAAAAQKSAAKTKKNSNKDSKAVK